jgi:hypothetical protein
VTEVLYLCAPVSAPTAALQSANLANAGLWLRETRRACPEVVIIAPWLLALLLRHDDDANPAQRERALRDCEAVAARCDGAILVGGAFSAGMRREAQAVLRRGGWVADLTSLGAEPPELLPAGLLAWGRQRWAERGAVVVAEAAS